MVKKFVLKRLS